MPFVPPGTIFTIEPSEVHMKKVAILGLLLTAAGVIAVATAGAVTSGKSVNVTLNEFNVQPAKQGAPTGSVTFNVTNSGKSTHEFVVVKTPKPAGSLTSHGGEASESGNVGEIGGLKSGQSKKLTLKLSAGHYALLCNLPGHYKAGQFVDFYVR
jgi:uncharacterized cupredoxin-like copper-binding protein